MPRLGFREQQRRLMCYYSPKNRNGVAWCHYCQQRVGSQMHELVNRNQTPKGSAARELTYSKEICSWLCPECHAVAHKRDIEAFLFSRNRKQYGKEIILSLLDQLELLLGFKPIVSLGEDFGDERRQDTESPNNPRGTAESLRGTGGGEDRSAPCNP